MVKRSALMQARSEATTGGRSHFRLVILALVTYGTAVNYLDRAVIGVAGPSMAADLGLNAVIMGVVFSAFSWTYTAAQIPGGVILDRMGTRITYAVAIGVWSLISAAQGLVVGLGSLLACRLGLGVAEAPCFPADSRVMSVWFPIQERARATSVYSVGMYIGLGVLSPFLFWIVDSFGWRHVFFFVGALGIVFLPFWWKLYQEPKRARGANQHELDHIAAGGGLEAKQANRPFSWSDIGFLCKQRQIQGASIGQFAGNCTLVFFLTWFPTYLATARGMDWLKVGLFAMLPYIAASVGVLVGGWVSDAIIRRTGSVNVGRKLPIIAGLLFASTIIVANYVDRNGVVIAILSFAFFGQGMVNLGWTVVADVAPKEIIGAAGGIFNFVTNLAGIITPLVIGVLVASTGSFVYGLIFIGACAIIGALAYIFVLGDITRIAMPERL